MNTETKLISTPFLAMDLVPFKYLYVYQTLYYLFKPFVPNRIQNNLLLNRLFAEGQAKRNNFPCFET